MIEVQDKFKIASVGDRVLAKIYGLKKQQLGVVASVRRSSFVMKLDLDGSSVVVDWQRLIKTVENKETWECNYCDLVWKDKAAWLQHFNETHTRCAYCGAVFFNSEFDDDYCVCAECRLKENEE